ncbi:hypothetical protein G9A89_015648 [Geosiphon pyriformis]|nr:hypothetical protein G9A89_015648 [Geosiphon pyriformis]
MTKKIPKSTYYGKYGLNGLFTKATAGTKKITTFFNISDAQTTDLQWSESNESLNNSESKLTVFEYNQKRTIFEYLTLLNDNNGHGKINASLKIAQKIFIDDSIWKA